MKVFRYSDTLVETKFKQKNQKKLLNTVFINKMNSFDAFDIHKNPKKNINFRGALSQSASLTKQVTIPNIKDIPFVSFFVKERGDKQFSSYELKQLYNLTKKQLKKAIPLFFLRERGDKQLNGYEVASFAKLPNDKYQRLLKIVAIKGRGKMQFSAVEIQKLLDLDKKAFNKIKPFLNLKNRLTNQLSAEAILTMVDYWPAKLKSAKGLLDLKKRYGNQFNFYDVKALLELSDKEFKKIKPFLFISKRGNYQLFGREIAELAKLPDGQFKRVKQLVYVPQRGENQFSYYEIKELSKLTPSEFKRAQKLFRIKKRTDFQFDAYEIYRFAKLKLSKYKELSKLVYIKERGDDQFTGNEIIKLLSLSKEDYKKAKKLFFVKERGAQQFTGNDIYALAILPKKDLARAKKLFYIPERKEEQFNGSEIIELIKLNESEFKSAQKMFYIPEKKIAQFRAYEISNWVKTLPKDRIDIAKKILHIESRGNKQFSMPSIIKIAMLPDDKFAKAQKLFYIPERKEQQFNEYEILRLAELNDKEFERASQLFYLDYKNFSQFSGIDICEIINLSDKNLEKAKDLFFIEGREKNQFSGWEINRLATHDDKTFQKIKELAYIKDRKHNQFSMSDIKKLLKLSDEEYKEAKELFYIPELLGTQLPASNIYDLIKIKHFDYKNAPYSQKIQNIYLLDTIFANHTRQSITNLYDYTTIRENIKKSIDVPIKYIPVSKQAKENFFRNFITFNNDVQEHTIKNLKPMLDKYAQVGLPLQFSRKNFISVLLSKLDEINPNERQEILNKLGIEFTEDKKGYNGFIDYSALDESKANEKTIKNLCQKFLHENKILTGDTQTDKFLNSLIDALPEFINCIGKQQHQAHQYTLDCHILRVLQEIVSNPKFKQLSNTNKMNLQLSAILHDIGKSEGIIDKNHEMTSSIYTYEILKKFNLPSQLKDKVTEFIKYHNWFQLINIGKFMPQQAAVVFRHPQSLLSAEIFTRADLKAVSNPIYETYSKNLDDKISEIKVFKKKFYQDGNLLFETRILNSEKIPTQEFNGDIYKVIDFTQIDDKTDLRKFGLSCKHKDEFRALFHSGNTSIMQNLTNPVNEAFICSSLISPAKKSTYFDTKVGMFLEVDNFNIINASYENQSSGTQRSFDDFVKFALTEKSQYRGFQSTHFIDMLEKYKLTREEFGLLYEKLADKIYKPQIKDIEINGKIIKKEDILKAYNYMENRLMDFAESYHNEINLYNPKIKGLVLIGNKLEEIPEKDLKFAHENNLPIFIMGAKN